MKVLITVCGFFCVGVIAQATGPFGHPRRPVLATIVSTAETGAGKRWYAARYRGLIVGRSSLRDVLRILGKPKRVHTPEGQSRTNISGQNFYVYPDAGEFPGQLTVEVDKRTGKAIAMECTPDYLTRDDAVKHFGAGYVETRYSSCGHESDEVAPIYEASDGQLLYIEYRKRGIAIRIGYANQVSSIEYVSSAIGFTSQGECEDEVRRFTAAQRAHRNRN
jgi:hypothetical protein